MPAFPLAAPPEELATPARTWWEWVLLLALVAGVGYMFYRRRRQVLEQEASLKEPDIPA
jgi:cbb3-type cytochrome oxidase subunit 3